MAVNSEGTCSVYVTDFGSPFARRLAAARASWYILWVARQSFALTMRKVLKAVIF
jgi:hypothetical protein